MLPKLEYVLIKMYNRIFAIMITHLMKIITCKLQILINVMKVLGKAIKIDNSGPHFWEQNSKTALI